MKNINNIILILVVFVISYIIFFDLFDIFLSVWFINFISVFGFIFFCYFLYNNYNKIFIIFLLIGFFILFYFGFSFFFFNFFGNFISVDFTICVCILILFFNIYYLNGETIYNQFWDNSKKIYIYFFTFIKLVAMYKRLLITVETGYIVALVQIMVVFSSTARLTIKFWEDFFLNLKKKFLINFYNLYFFFKLTYIDNLKKNEHLLINNEEIELFEMNVYCHYINNIDTKEFLNKK